MVSITEALLDSLQGDAPVRQLVLGPFWSVVVLDTDPPRSGLASTLRGEPGKAEPPVSEAGMLLNKTARELSKLLHSPKTLEASIGLAAFNALLEVDESSCKRINAAELILERGAGRHVAIVGHFPFIEQVRKVAARCDVLELIPRPGDLPAQQASAVLPRADVIGITSTTLINHTFDHMIQLCRADAFVILLGGSTPLSPVPFQYGVDGVAGTRLQDVPAALRAVSQGATFRQIPGKRLLLMAKDKE